ncbi:MAG: insulinase family protein, partial [Ruminococcaceae bacterium]|nr:insulinase family protein [Oscillospiraceae bacterium]
MKIITYKINESVILDHISTDKFKKARFSITFSLPADIKHYAAGALLFPVSMRATEEFPDFASLCRRCDELYAVDISDTASTRGGVSFRGLRAGMLDNKYAEDGVDILDGAMHIMSQIILAPVMSKKDIENEKLNAKNRIKAQKNSAFRFAWQRFREIMMKDYPGTLSAEDAISSIDALSKEGLEKYRRFMQEHANIEFFYCGEQSPERVTELIKKHFSPLLEKRKTLPLKPAKFTSKEPKYINEMGNYSQSQLICGFSSDTLISDPDFYAAELANEVFGEGPVSKLFLNLREKKSLCYLCASDYNEIAGVLTVESGIDARDREKAQKEIFAQLLSLQRGKISDAELEAAKMAIYADCAEAEDHPEDYEEFSRLARVFGGPSTIDEYREGISKVNKDDIAAA